MNAKNRWLQVITAISLLLSLTLSACSPAATPTPAQNTSPTQPAAALPTEAKPADGQATAPATGETTVPVTGAAKEITAWGFVWTADWLEAIAPGFEEQHPGVKIKVGRFEYDPYQDMVLTTLASGSGVPDVVTLDPLWAGDLIRSDTLKPLDKANELNKADFVPGGYDMYAWQDVQYGMPLDLDFNLLFYRKDVYDKAMQTLGMTEMPKDTDNFIKLAKEVTKETGKPAIILYNHDYYAWYQSFLAPLGGNLINDAGTEYIFNNDAGVKALQLFLDLINKEKVAKLWDSSVDGDPIVALKANDAMAVMHGSWFATELASGAPEMSGKWSITSLPFGDANREFDASTGGACLSIPKSAKEPDLAWEFIKYSMSPENQVKYYQIVAGVPSLKTAWTDPAMDEVNPYYGLPVGRNVADWSLRTMPMQLPSIELSDLIGEAIAKAADGSMSPKEALDEAVNAAPPLTQ